MSKRIMAKHSFNSQTSPPFWLSWTSGRELKGDQIRFYQNDLLFYHLYKSFTKETSFTSVNRDGIFNLQYSLDGNLLIAATENKSLLIFDPHNKKQIEEVQRAHGSSVNYVKFLDPRMFATCSDDCSVKLWDVRNVKKHIKQLHGHSNWVKNIEYDHQQGLLVSSGYDGHIFVWDINTLTKVGQPFTVNNLLRMRLTNDLSKMIISTNDGFILVIHDLNLKTLKSDLRGFPSEYYRLMQKNFNCGIDMGSWYNDLFAAKRNRVELISDFPNFNDCGSISSLEVHPHDWCVASRNTSKHSSPQAELSEWTSVHNIQDDERPTEFINVKPSMSFLNFTSQHRLNPEAGPNVLFGENNPVIIISNHRGSPSPQATFLEYSKDYQEIRGTECKVYQNISRLRFHISEPNVNEDFIKEISFSSDGRVICSPYKFGYRILGFSANCSEICDVVKESEQLMHVLKKCNVHRDYVVTTRFSPNRHQIASGCLGGQIIFSQPVL